MGEQINYRAIHMSTESLEWFDIPGALSRNAAALLGLSKVPIVELDNTHRPLILAHLLALSHEDRRMRFGHPLGDSAIAKYVDKLDFSRDALFGIFGKDQQLVGVVHLGVLPKKPESTTPLAAELGISLSEEVRGHGLGTLLFKRAIRRARNQNVEAIFIYTLLENDAMLRIAQKCNMKVKREDGQYEAWLQVIPGSTTSHIREFVDEQLADLDLLFKEQINQIKRWADL